MEPRCERSRMSGLAVGPDAHEDAFETFAERALEHHGEAIRDVILFGSAASGETRGVDSDVDVLVVADAEDLKASLREIAYDVQLEYGVVVSLHVLTAERFEDRRNHPFVRSVLQHGRSYE